MAVNVHEGINVAMKNYAASLASSFALLLGTNTQVAAADYLKNTVLGQPEFSECASDYKNTNILSDQCDLLWSRLEAKLAGRSEKEQDEVVRQRGVVLETRRLDREKQLAEQEKSQAARIEEQGQLWEEEKIRRKKGAPKNISKLAKLDFCALYGRVLRDELEDSSEINYFDDAHLQKVVKAEAKKRGIALNDKKIKSEVVNIGMGICSMYASLGIPTDENRSVGSWGVHIQHVYSGIYVYTENGAITSWQD